MKTHTSRRNHGFTLVELLVVIAIIAVLAGAGFAAANSAIQKAKKTTALATVVAIEQAISQFYSEYGAMPKDGLTTDTTVNTETDLELLKVLLGTETGTAPLNTRANKFLSVKEGKAKKNGLIYATGGSTISGLYDPWGGKYFIRLDGDYDERVKPEPPGGGSVQLNGRRSAAWSNGADGVTSGGTSADDVKNW